jgi:hypothetical protein
VPAVSNTACIVPICEKVMKIFTYSTLYVFMIRYCILTKKRTRHSLVKTQQCGTSCISSNPRTTDTKWRHKSKLSEKLGWCGRQDMLRLSLRILDWDWIFVRAVIAISSLGVRSPWSTPCHSLIKLRQCNADMIMAYESSVKLCLQKILQKWYVYL